MVREARIMVNAFMLRSEYYEAGNKNDMMPGLTCRIFYFFEMEDWLVIFGLV